MVQRTRICFIRSWSLRTSHDRRPSPSRSPRRRRASRRRLSAAMRRVRALGRRRRATDLRALRGIHLTRTVGAHLPGLCGRRRAVHAIVGRVCRMSRRSSANRGNRARRSVSGDSGAHVASLQVSPPRGYRTAPRRMADGFAGGCPLDGSGRSRCTRAHSLASGNEPALSRRRRAGASRGPKSELAPGGHSSADSRRSAPGRIVHRRSPQKRSGRVRSSKWSDTSSREAAPYRRCAHHGRDARGMRSDVAARRSGRGLRRHCRAEQLEPLFGRRRSLELKRRKADHVTPCRAGRLP